MQALLLIALSMALAQVAHSGSTKTPKPVLSDTQLMSQGMWRDPKSQMIWMRCSLGQTWTGRTCTGTASEHEWQDAQDAVAAMNRNGGFGGYTDWVVPHIQDLNSLIRCSTGFKSTVKTPAKRGGETTVQERCKDGYQRPTIDQAIFPNTPAWFYWSVSPYADYKGLAWYAEFDYGGTGDSYKEGNFNIRAVRTSHRQQ